MKDQEVERQIHHDRHTEADPNIYALGILGDPIQLAHLLNEKRNWLLRRNIRREFGRSTPEQLLELTGTLLKGIGTTDEEWDTDRKDGSVHLLREMPLDRVDPHRLFEQYQQELSNQKKPIDPTGNIFTLLEAGRILTPHFPPTDETIHVFTATLDSAAQDLQKDRDDHHGIRARMISLIQHMHQAKKAAKPNEDKASPSATADTTNVSEVLEKRYPQPELEKIWDPATPEHDLIAAAKKGDSGAFSVLVKKAQADIYNLAYKLTGNEDDARDVAQEAFLRAFRALRRFRGDSKFSTWMYRITANVASTHLTKRTKGKHDLLPDDDAIRDEHPESDPESMAEAALARERIAAVLADLPQILRDVVILRDVLDLPHDAIAAELGITESAAKVRLHRARRKLRDRLYPLQENTKATSDGVEEKETLPE